MQYENKLQTNGLNQHFQSNLLQKALVHNARAFPPGAYQRKTSPGREDICHSARICRTRILPFDHSIVADKVYSGPLCTKR